MKTKTEEYCQKTKILQESCRVGITSCFTTAFWVSLYTLSRHFGYNISRPTESVRIRKIIHPYSDMLSNHFINSYSIEEIISEKFRALLQRNYAAPRDYYDLWYITKNIASIKWEKVAVAFKEKCDHKNITYKSTKDFFDKNKIISSKREWDNSLNHHLKSVPPFDDVIADIKEQIADKKIFPEH